MKDVLISGRRLARELRIFLGCFVFALALNIYSIHEYNTQWKELLTTLHITLAVAIVVYVLLAILRFVICGVSRLFRRKTG
jgi:putative effector of murein hydrolase